MPTQIAYATVVSGSSISGTVQVPHGRQLGVWAPILSSGTNVFLQAAFGEGGTTPASANFVRVQNAAGSGDLTLGPAGATPGSRAYYVEPAFPFSHLRVETSVAQTDTRTFAVIAKWGP